MRRRVRFSSWVLLGLTFALALFALVIEPRRLVLHEERIELPHWRKAHAGLKVALFSDLHVGSPHWGLSRLRELIRRTNAERPDLILLAGDFMINDVMFGTWTAPEPISEVLGELHAPLGVVAVLGNHDWWNDGDQLTHALVARGIIVLENQVLPIEYRGAPFYVVGLADHLTREQRA